EPVRLSAKYPDSTQIITNSTKNQLMLAPMRIPKILASWIEPPPPNTTEWSQVARLRRGGMPRHDRRGVGAGRQRPERKPRVAGQPGGAERVGDGRRCVADEQRALQRERQFLDDAPRPRLE